MPTVTFDARVTQTEEIYNILVTRDNGDFIKTEVFIDEFGSLAEFAEWVINQSVTGRSPSNLQRRITVEFHTEEVPEPETGEIVTVRVVDNVSSVILPADQGKTDFENLPGWATWTGQEAEDWINANVADLPSAKVALVAMARAIVALRNRVID